MAIHDTKVSGVFIADAESDMTTVQSVSVEGWECFCVDTGKTHRFVSGAWVLASNPNAAGGSGSKAFSIFSG